ncbi:hypothetical protein HDV04_005242 [Boothiomyces sp. JEL0838]|nr:hypothetical protein HDV04_005242 [Boothiomyces sp. JEL0838]
MQFTTFAAISALCHSTLAAAVSSSSGLTPLCNEPTQLCNIDPSKYIGDWYEIGRTAIIRGTFESGCDCVQAKYAFKPDGDIQVTNTCVKNQKYSTIVGNAHPLSPSELKVTFSPAGFNGGIGTFFQNLIPGPNYVVKNVWTDADGNYERALIVSPLHIPGIEKYTESIWILSRNSSIPQADIDESLAYATAAGFHPVQSKWEPTDQTTCAKYVPGN